MEAALDGRKPSPNSPRWSVQTQMREPVSESRSSSCPSGVRRVHDRRARAETAAVCEPLDGPDSVLGEALLDLARLLVGVHVQRQRVLVRIAAELLEPVARARTNGVGGDADSNAGVAQLSSSRDRRQPTLCRNRSMPPRGVRDVEQHDLDACLGGGVRGSVCLLEAQVWNSPTAV